MHCRQSTAPAAGGSVTFPVSISEFICGSVNVKDSVVLYILNHFRTPSLTCRLRSESYCLDKGSQG